MRVTSRMIAGTAVTVVVIVSAWVAVANEANRDAETTPTTGSRSSVGSSSSTAVSTSTTAVTASTTVTSTTSATTSTSTTVPQLSPAWVGAQQRLDVAGTWAHTVEGAAEARRAFEYSLSNPNQWSTPMGALCWADHELSRVTDMLLFRELLDEDFIPMLMEELGIGDDQVPSGPSRARSRAVIGILESYTSTTTTSGTTPTTMASGFIDPGFVAMLRALDYGGGTGLEWLDALDEVASPEWAVAVRAEDGLPADVLRYADGLAANARRLLASSTPRMTGYMYGPFVDGYEAFVEAAKYDQNCLRTMIGDPPPNIPAQTTTTTEADATTTTLRSGSVRVIGAGLNGVLRLGLSGVGVGYSRPGGAGSLTDTTFRYGGVGYEVERLLWWPNGTVRLNVYPDGLHTAVGDDAYLVITPGEDDNPIEHVWDTADARYLGGGAHFVWDTTFTPEFGTVYRVEFRIGVPGVPENVRLSGTSVVWDAGEGPAAEKYHVWIRPATPGPGTDSFFNTPTFATETHWDMRGMARYVGDSFVFQVRARNSAGYSPWTEPQTFTTPGAPTTSTTEATTSHDVAGYRGGV